MGATRSGDYRHAVPVKLDEDEFVPYRGYVWLRTGRLAWIMTAWTREDADEWAEALDNVMTGAELAQRGARK